MSMTEEQILANISFPFHAEYRNIRQTYLQPSEKIFAVADCSFSTTSASKKFGIFILTDYRAIIVFFNAKGRKTVRYHRDWGLISFLSGIIDNRDWVQPPTEPLSKRELKTRQIREALFSVIGTISREEHTVKMGTQKSQILDLYFLGKDNKIIGYIGGFGDYHMAFALNDGQKIYNLINTARQNGGRIEPKKEGVYIMGDTYNISGDFRNAFVNINSTLVNVTQSINTIPGANNSIKHELRELVNQLNNELQKVPSEKSEEAAAVAETTKSLVDTVSKEKPNKVMVQVSADGLKQAARNLAAVTPTVLTIATQIVATIMKIVG